MKNRSEHIAHTVGIVLVAVCAIMWIGISSAWWWREKPAALCDNCDE